MHGNNYYTYATAATTDITFYVERSSDGTFDDGYGYEYWSNFGESFTKPYIPFASTISTNVTFYEPLPKDKDVFKHLQHTLAVSPQSNHAYKKTGTSGTINLSIKGGAFFMPTNKLTIVPVKFDPLPTRNSSPHSFQQTAEPSCVIKTSTFEFSFFNGVDEHIIQAVMKELIQK